MTSSGAPPIDRHTAAVDGFVVPDALLVPDDWAPSLFVRISPVEVSWFAGVPVARAVEVCREVTGVEPHVRRVIDRYFDTPGLDLFGRRVSVRVRQHVEPPRAIAFEVIATGWGADAIPRPLSGFVQTFARNDEAMLERLLERYAREGYRQVAAFDKVRYTFPVVRGRSVDGAGREIVSGELRGVGEVHPPIRVIDFGVKVEVDDLRDSPFPEPAIIEVDYAPGHVPRARPIADGIVAALGARLRAKTTSKLAYLLGSPR
ncbi:hypothetical protein [Longimicrobium sp.]|uniref:hypothetical protein n=1 Tax=Longimicrobium sp. TaxID=2029185 RepID=UPI002B8E57BC|nr:hypothetical protein [Longimicrobium sp.]HSU15959.1 hypothetical protein [Longimicrobium sp.]